MQIGLTRRFARRPTIPVLGWSLLFSTGTPLPLCLQNLENNGFVLRLCARSLSLQDLQAKSREHGSYGEAPRILGPVLELGGRHLERARETMLSPGSDCQRSKLILQITYAE
jgi:hypothetical protein